MSIAKVGFGIDFTGKITLVSGGLKGLGYGITTALAKAGGTVACLYNTSADAPKIAEQLSSEYGVKIRAYQCDVGDSAKVASTVDQIEKDLGNIDYLVANAGISVVKPATELTAEDFKKVFDVNCLGVFNCAQACGKKWIARQSGGSIVIISSMSSQIINFPITQVFYNSSKAAVSNLGRGLASEWAEHKIRVNMVSPGFIETDQTGGMPLALRTSQAASVPLGRFSKPSEHAGQTLLLLSDYSSYTTGAEMFNDGGFLTR